MRIQVGIFVLLMLGLTLSWYYWSGEDDAQRADVATDYPIARTIKYSFLVKNPGATLIENADFWAYAPVKQTDHQLVVDIKSSVDFALDVDELGNQRLLFNTGPIPPFGQRSVDVSVALRLSGDAVKANIPRGESLAAQAYIETDDSRLKKKAKALSRDDPSETAQAIFDWVKSSVENKGYVKKDRGALYALTTGEGDCSEHMYLYAALSRINGIPARGMAGFLVKESGIIKASRQHNWAEVMLNGNWVVVDTDNATYAPAATDYLAMRIIDKTSRFHGDGSQELFGGVNKLDVIMN